MEALTTLEDYQTVTTALSCPVLANITEFGQTPLLTRDELRSVGVKMALYPWAVGRMMNQAAWTVMQAIREAGTQQPWVEAMQDRKTLYEILNYDQYE